MKIHPWGFNSRLRDFVKGLAFHCREGSRFRAELWVEFTAVSMFPRGWGHHCRGSWPPPLTAEGPVTSDHVLCPSCSTCACVEYYGKALEALVKGTEVMCIHGKMKHKRDKIFTGFRGLQRWGSFAEMGLQPPHAPARPSAQSPAGDVSTACSPLRPSYHMPSVQTPGARPSVPTPLHVAAPLLGFSSSRTEPVCCVHAWLPGSGPGPGRWASWQLVNG